MYHVYSVITDGADRMVHCSFSVCLVRCFKYRLKLSHCQRDQRSPSALPCNVKNATWCVFPVIISLPRFTNFSCDSLLLIRSVLSLSRLTRGPGEADWWAIWYTSHPFMEFSTKLLVCPITSSTNQPDSGFSISIAVDKGCGCEPLNSLWEKVIIIMGRTLPMYICGSCF